MLVHLPERKKGEKYSCQLMVAGFEEVVGQLKAHMGVMHRVDIVLKKAE